MSSPFDVVSTPSKTSISPDPGASDSPSSRFVLHDALGQGAFGSVFRATDNLTGEEVAVKIIDLAECDDDIEEVQKEIDILQACSSDYVPRFVASFLAGEKLWIVMELMTGGSCGDILQTHELAEEQIAVILRDVLLGLEISLHSTGKIHRDIKGGLNFKIQDAHQRTSD